MSEIRDALGLIVVIRRKSKLSAANNPPNPALVSNFVPVQFSPAPLTVYVSVRLDCGVVTPIKQASGGDCDFFLAHEGA
jgi:hypothetical protein